MAAGIAEGVPEAQIRVLPLADGGDGTFEVLARVSRAQTEHCAVRGPNGERVTARVGITGRSGFCEMADAAGVGAVPPAERDPFHASTYGVGEQIATLLDRGVTRVIIGAGGSGTLDAGAGALAALGARFLDARGRSLEPTPAGLEPVESVDVSGLDPRLRTADLVVLADVVVALRDSARIFGAQKGLRPETAGRLDAILERLDWIGRRDGHRLLDWPWHGAGGGLPAGLHAFAGGRSVPGALYVAARLRLARALRGADLLLTGEGRLDITSFTGKAPLAAAAAAAHRGVATVVLAGEVTEDLPPLPGGVRAVALGTTPDCDPAVSLARVTEAAARLGRGGW